MIIFVKLPNNLVRTEKKFLTVNVLPKLQFVCFFAAVIGLGLLLLRVFWAICAQLLYS